MRILVLSDLHANPRFRNCPDRGHGRWDGVPSAGDVVGYGPDPNE